MEKTKIVLIICDGIGDRLNNGKTPLEEANKENFDEISKRGINGLMYAIAPGIAPGSDTAHLSIFGYDPYKYYTGRGPFEALG
ncbi:MAG: phosphoglycerate mutase, partial [Candidatus Altarchaeaceae archaeon]